MHFYKSIIESLCQIFLKTLIKMYLLQNNSRAVVLLEMETAPVS